MGIMAKTPRLKFTAKLTGAAELRRELRRLQKAYPEAVQAGLVEEAYAIEAASVALVPVDTGRLRATHYVSAPEEKGDDVTVEIGYGTDYAVYVHERLELTHKSPTQAKFLQQPLEAARSGFFARLAARIRARAGG